MKKIVKEKLNNLVVNKDINYYLRKLEERKKIDTFKIMTKEITPTQIFNEIKVDLRLFDKIDKNDAIIYLVEYLDNKSNTIYVNLGQTSGETPYLRPCKHVKIGTGENQKQDKTAINTLLIKDILGITSAKITLIDKIDKKYIETLENNYINTITFNTELLVVNQSSASSKNNNDLVNKIDTGFIDVVKKYPQIKNILYPLL